MLARKVYVRLQANSLNNFKQLMERKIFPWLRMQEGFLELIVLATPDETEIQVLSFWDHEGKAGDYDGIEYPADVLKSLETVLDGITYGRTFEIVSSTLTRHSQIDNQGATECHLQPVDASVAGRQDCTTSLT